MSSGISFIAAYESASAPTKITNRTMDFIDGEYISVCKLSTTSEEEEPSLKGREEGGRRARARDKSALLITRLAENLMRH